MSGLSSSPRLVKGGLVFIDARTAAVQRIVSLQYNPDNLQRTLQVQGTGAAGDRSEALRLKGPPIETIKLEAEIDATDQLEFSDRNPATVALGIHPQLAELELAAYPSSSALQANEASAGMGSIEIVPLEADLTLFVWSAQRILPVRITDFNVTEEAFDPALNPIRAKVSLGMRVLSVDDVGFGHPAGGIFMAYLKAKETISGRTPPRTLSNLGIGGLP